MPEVPVNTARLSVSIVLHRSPPDLLRSCLASLASAAAQARDAGSLGSLVVYIIDNASGATYRDEQLTPLLSAFPESEWCTLQYLPQGENHGFGAGHNTVLTRLESDYHLVLNPDAELAPDALQRALARMAADRGIVLLSPRVTGGDGAQEFLCKSYPSVLVLLLRGFAPGFVRRPFRARLHAYEVRDRCVSGNLEAVELASGCCMLLRSSALQAVAGFDERFFLYFEDFDLSLRLQRQGRLVFDPLVRVTHHGGYAASKGLHHVGLFVRSAVRFFNLHGWRWV